MKLFDCASVGFLLVLSANMLIIFFLAFFNGYECLVAVDRFGEARLEAVLFPLWFIMGTVTLARMVRKSMSGGKRN